MLPLEGCRVLEWTVYQQGPVAGLMLADLGAEVIKMEPPGQGDFSRVVGGWMGLPTALPGGKSFYYEVYNYNKKGIALDLKKPQAREVVYRLVERSDVFLTNFRPGVAQRLGLDYETLARHNPRLIYAQATGYGRQGPHASRPAVDPTIAARSGITASLTPRGMDPHYPALALVDQAGAMTLAYSVLAALLAREKTGKGLQVDCSLFSSALWLEALHVNTHLLLGRDLSRFDRERAVNPLANYYRCADGRWLYLWLGESQRFWPAFCHALGLEHLEKDPRFDNPKKRAQHHKELIALLDQTFAQKPLEAWLKVLAQHPDFVFDAVQPPSQLAQDPQVVANQFIQSFTHPTLGEIKLVAPPLKFNGDGLPVRCPAPELGQHTEEVLKGLCGYTADEVAALRQAGVLG